MITEVHEAYDFGSERVHVARGNVKSIGYSCYRCDKCALTKPIDHFESVAHRNDNTKCTLFLHPVCHSCRDLTAVNLRQHELYSPALMSFVRKLVSQARQGGNKRGIVFAISPDDVLGIYFQQRGICAVSGIEMDWKTREPTGRCAHNYRCPSIDRIDSEGNYVIGNVHLVMQIVNTMKTDLPMDIFVAMCRQIAAYNVSGVV